VNREACRAYPERRDAAICLGCQQRGGTEVCREPAVFEQFLGAWEADSSIRHNPGTVWRVPCAVGDNLLKMIDTTALLIDAYAFAINIVPQ